MNEIRNYQQKTYVTLEDGRILTTDRSPEEIYSRLDEHSHIMIDGELLGKFFVKNARIVSMDDIENLILAQPKDIQNKVRQKRKRLKEERGVEMTLSYLQNYLSNLTD